MSEALFALGIILIGVAIALTFGLAAAFFFVGAVCVFVVLGG